MTLQIHPHLPECPSNQWIVANWSLWHGTQGLRATHGFWDKCWTVTVNLITFGHLARTTAREITRIFEAHQKLLDRVCTFMNKEPASHFMKPFKAVKATSYSLKNLFPKTIMTFFTPYSWSRVGLVNPKLTQTIHQNYGLLAKWFQKKLGKESEQEPPKKAPLHVISYNNGSKTILVDLDKSALKDKKAYTKLTETFANYKNTAAEIILSRTANGLSFEKSLFHINGSLEDMDLFPPKIFQELFLSNKIPTTTLTYKQKPLMKSSVKKPFHRFQLQKKGHRTIRLLRHCRDESDIQWYHMEKIRSSKGTQPIFTPVLDKALSQDLEEKMAKTQTFSSQLREELKHVSFKKDQRLPTETEKNLLSRLLHQFFSQPEFHTLAIQTDIQDNNGNPHVIYADTRTLLQVVPKLLPFITISENGMDQLDWKKCCKAWVKPDDVNFFPSKHHLCAFINEMLKASYHDKTHRPLQFFFDPLYRKFSTI
jgi:hypothetical protein